MWLCEKNDAIGNALSSADQRAKLPFDNNIYLMYMPWLFTQSSYSEKIVKSTWLTSHDEIMELAAVTTLVAASGGD